MKLVLLLLSLYNGVLTDFICPVDEPVEVGIKGSVLRMRIVAETCNVDYGKVSGRCYPKFNISLARGELYRSYLVDMRLYGSQLCLRNKREAIGLDKVTTRDQGCERNCYKTSLNVLPWVVSEAYCYKKWEFSNPLEVCPLTGSKGADRILKITISETNLATERDYLGISNCTMDYETSWNGLESTSVTLTFEDCLKIREEEMPRCNRAQVYIDGVVSDTLQMKDDTEYERVVMLGLNSYLQLWYKGETLCLGTNVKTRKMDHRTFMSGPFIVKEKISQRCEKSCQNMRNNPVLEFIYHTEAFVQQYKTDTNATKYIKVTAKLSEKKMSNGSISKSDPISVLGFLLTSIFATLLLG